MVATSERNLLTYPPLPVDKDCITGLIPIDFLVERFIEKGIEWFRNTAEAPKAVYGHLLDADLADKYGQKKIDEIATYIQNTEIDVKQSFPMEDEETPSISINLQSSIETDMVGLNDHAGMVYALGAENARIGAREQGYTPVKDEVLIGIHATASPDKTKYLYYLVIYILNAFKDQLEERPGKVNSLFNITWRATDISRLNEWLPSHVFSRFVTLTAEHFAIFEKAPVPFATDFNVDVEVDQGG